MLDGVATTRDGTLKTSRGHNDESGGRDVGSHIGALVTLQREIDEDPVIVVKCTITNANFWDELVMWIQDIGE